MPSYIAWIVILSAQGLLVVFTGDWRSALVVLLLGAIVTSTALAGPYIASFIWIPPLAKLGIVTSLWGLVAALLFSGVFFALQRGLPGENHKGHRHKQ